MEQLCHKYSRLMSTPTAVRQHLPELSAAVYKFTSFWVVRKYKEKQLTVHGRTE